MTRELVTAPDAARSPTSTLSPAAAIVAEPRNLVFACPACRSTLELISESDLRCPSDGGTFARVDGVWSLLVPQRAAYFDTFVREYEAVRRAEGRGADDAAYYRALPDLDLSGRFTSDWRIRARSFKELLDRVVRPIELSRGRSLTILDVGAGNGWLAYRLALRRHHVVAIDVLTNTFDGLGAHTRYDAAFTAIQAEFDRLPLASGQADVVIFNGAIHYSTDYETTLSEGLRVLRDDGVLVVMDSPVYRSDLSGRLMVREREEQFERAYGFPSNALPSENYLTFDRLDELADGLGLTWSMTEPFYGFRWALRPWKARLRRRREPARFLLIVGRRSSTTAPHGNVGTLKARAWRRWLAMRYRLFQRGRHNRLTLETVAGRDYVILPTVFNPALFRSGAFLADSLNAQLVPPGCAVLDMGTGSGVGAVTAAAWADSVVAIDINPAAVRCARINALLNEVDDRVDVREGDLFAATPRERFDVVLFNPPYFRGQPRDVLDRAWRSDDVLERFASQLECHLSSRGYALIVLSSDADERSCLRALRERGFDIGVVAQTDLINETLTVYRVNAKRT